MLTPDEVDEFVAKDKRLRGFVHEWQPTLGGWQQARWPIEDGFEDTLQAELVLSVDPAQLRPSVSLLFQRNPITRLDVVPHDEQKPNPPRAHALGLPPFISGTHIHGWDENRQHCINAGFGELPYRRELDIIEPLMRNAVVKLCEVSNIHMSAEQRLLDLPERTLV